MTNKKKLVESLNNIKRILSTVILTHKTWIKIEANLTEIKRIVENHQTNTSDRMKKNHCGYCGRIYTESDNEPEKSKRSGEWPALNREELLKKAKSMWISVPCDMSTIRLDSRLNFIEADKIFSKKKRRKR